MSAIQVARLSYFHPAPARPLRPALANVNLQLPAGSRTLLIGANGGQSLLLHTTSSYSSAHSRKVNPPPDPRGQEAHQHSWHRRQGKGLRRVP
jgi:ABC-type uncharacterized transport system ATPase subunit